MSHIAALLLMYVEDEMAFWCLDALMRSPRHYLHGRLLADAHSKAKCSMCRLLLTRLPQAAVLRGTLQTRSQETFTEGVETLRKAADTMDFSSKMVYGLLPGSGAPRAESLSMS